MLAWFSPVKLDVNVVLGNVSKFNCLTQSVLFNNYSNLKIIRRERLLREAIHAEGKFYKRNAEEFVFRWATSIFRQYSFLGEHEL